MITANNIRPLTATELRDMGRGFSPLDIHVAEYLDGRRVVAGDGFTEEVRATAARLITLTEALIGERILSGTTLCTRMITTLEMIASEPSLCVSLTGMAECLDFVKLIMVEDYSEDVVDPIMIGAVRKAQEALTGETEMTDAGMVWVAADFVCSVITEVFRLTK